MPPTAEEIYYAAAAAGARPDPLLTISQWADQYRKLSQRASAEPGPWRTDRTPYLREIMDCLSPVVAGRARRVHEGRADRRHRVRQQLDRLRHPPGAGADAGGAADRRDGQAQLEAAHRSADRGVRVLRELVQRPRSRDSGNTVLSKEFPGGVLVMTGANSAVGLRSMPARYLFLDEVDAYPGDVEGEGDPVDLARRARARSPGARCSWARRRRSRA